MQTLIHAFTQIGILLLSGVSTIALVFVVGALFPKWIRRTTQVAEAHPGRSFLVGLVNFLFFASITLGFGLLARNSWGGFIAPALVFAAPLGLGLCLGAVGMVEVVGGRLFPGQSPAARTFLAAGLLYIACLTPIVGWFGLTAYIGIAGLGGLILGFFRKEDREIVKS